MKNTNERKILLAWAIPTVFFSLSILFKGKSTFTYTDSIQQTWCKRISFTHQSGCANACKRAIEKEKDREWRGQARKWKKKKPAKILFEFKRKNFHALECAIWKHFLFDLFFWQFSVGCWQSSANSTPSIEYEKKIIRAEKWWKWIEKEKQKRALTFENGFGDDFKSVTIKVLKQKLEQKLFYTLTHRRENGTRSDKILFIFQSFCRVFFVHQRQRACIKQERKFIYDEIHFFLLF